MGLLNSLKSVATKVLDTVVTTYSKPLAVAKAVISPTTTVKQVVSDFRAQPIETQKKSVIVAAAGYSAALVGAAVAASATAVTAVGTAVKAVIPATAKGKVIAAVAAPVVVGAVVRQPAEAVKAVVSAPSQLAQFGGDVAQFAANPSISNAKQIVTESPIISSIVAVAGAATVGAVAANVVGGALTRNEMQKQTEILEKSLDKPLSSAPVGAAPQTPITPATAPLIATAGSSTSTSGTKRRRYTKQKAPSVNQRVNILISNKNQNLTSKKYLNRRLLA